MIDLPDGGHREKHFDGDGRDVDVKRKRAKHHVDDIPAALSGRTPNIQTIDVG